MRGCEVRGCEVRGCANGLGRLRRPEAAFHTAPAVRTATLPLVHQPKRKDLGVGIEAHIAPRPVRVLFAAPRLRGSVCTAVLPSPLREPSPARPASLRLVRTKNGGLKRMRRIWQMRRIAPAWRESASMPTPKL